MIKKKLVLHSQINCSEEAFQTGNICESYSLRLSEVKHHKYASWRIEDLRKRKVPNPNGINS